MCVKNIRILLSVFYAAICLNVQGQDSLTLGFGSCNRTSLDQSHWKVIETEQIDGWIWLGDIVYADSKKPKKIKKAYSKLKKNKEYTHFEKQHDIYGTWDDHDYGENDGGVDFISKQKSRDILYNFLDISKNDKARSRTGAYQSFRLEKGGLSVRLILLDVRYFRDKLEKNPVHGIRYIPNPNAKLLGADQWHWFEKELYQAKEDVIIIGSGTQIIPEEHGYEKWSDYPSERNRFLDLIKQNASKSILLLSGDRHMAEVSAIAVNHELFLYEITSSGLTHTWTENREEPNAYRIRSKFPVKNFGLLHLIKQKGNGAISTTAELKNIDGARLDYFEIFPQ